jgi:hypothetical protein
VKGTSGQVLVYHDLLGMYPNFTPKFCKRYAEVGEQIEAAIKNYKTEVDEMKFPNESHAYAMKPEEFKKAFLVDMPDIFEELSKKSSAEKPTKTTETMSTTTATTTAPAVAPASTSTSTIPSSNEKKKIETSSSTPTIRTSMRKTIAIIGGGALGSLIGGKIAATEQFNVWMLTSWKEHVEKIKRDGLVIRNVDYTTRRINNLNVTMELEEILNKSGYVDYVFVLVKSPLTRNAAEKAVKLIHPTKGRVLTLQNGLGNREILAEVIGDQNKILQVLLSFLSKQSNKTLPLYIF